MPADSCLDFGDHFDVNPNEYFDPVYMGKLFY